MRIRVLSELHLAQDDGLLELPRSDCDVVILAGNIDLENRALPWVRKQFPSEQVIYVLGTHEYYLRTIPDYAEEFAEEARQYGIHVLEHREIKMNGVRFLGCTLWTDFELFGRPRLIRTKNYLSTHLNWFKYIRYGKQQDRDEIYPLDVEDVCLLHQESRRWLEEQLSSVSTAPTVVVTHHAPCTRSISKEKQNQLITASKVVNLDDLVESSGVALWIHSQLRTSSDYQHGATRVVCNPRGTHGYAGFDPAFVVEI